MTRRRVLALRSVGFVVVVALAGVGASAMWPRSIITEEAAKQAREGMALAEVEAVLGGPARDETSGDGRLVETALFVGFISPDPPGTFSAQWIGPEYAV